MSCSNKKDQLNKKQKSESEGRLIFDPAYSAQILLEDAITALTELLGLSRSTTPIIVPRFFVQYYLDLYLDLP